MLVPAARRVSATVQSPLAVSRDLGPVGSGSASRPRHVLVRGGAEFVLKLPAWSREPHPYICANEWIAGLIALQCGLPVLRMAVVRHPAGLAVGWKYLGTGLFASLASDPRLIAAAQNADAVYLIAVFDALVRNVDRHAGNVVAQRISRNAPVFRLLAYDHDRALIHPLVRPDHLWGLPDLDDSRLWLRAPGLRAALTDRQQLHAAVDMVRTRCSVKDVEEIVASTPREWLAPGLRRHLIHFVAQRLTTLDLLVNKHAAAVLPHLT